MSCVMITLQRMQTLFEHKYARDWSYTEGFASLHYATRRARSMLPSRDGFRSQKPLPAPKGGGIKAKRRHMVGVSFSSRSVLFLFLERRCSIGAWFQLPHPEAAHEDYMNGGAVHSPPGPASIELILCVEKYWLDSGASAL